MQYTVNSIAFNQGWGDGVGARGVAWIDRSRSWRHFIFSSRSWSGKRRTLKN